MAATAARSMDGPPRTPSSRRRAAQLVEHGEGVVGRDRREADRDVVEHLGQDAAEPDHDDRPERGVPAHPDDQLEPRIGHRLDQQPASVDAVPPRRREQLGGSGPDLLVADEADADEPEVALVDQPDGIELERHGVPGERPGRLGRGVRVGHRDDRGDRDARGAQQVQALPLRECTRAGAHRRRRGSRPSPVRCRTTSDRRRATATSPATGRHRSRRARRRSQRAAAAMAVNASDGAAQQRRSSTLPVEEGLGLGRRFARGQRHVHGQDVRPVARRVEELGRHRVGRGHLGAEGSIREVVHDREDVVDARPGHRLEGGPVGRSPGRRHPRDRADCRRSPSWADRRGCAPPPAPGWAAGRRRCAAPGRR